VTSNPFRRITGVLFLSLALGLAYLAGLLSSTVAQPAARASDPDANALFAQAWQLVEGKFYGTLPTTQTRAYAAIRGMLDSLNDPYTVLIEPPAAKLETDELRGTFGGIGADLRRDANANTLLSPYPDGPAAQAGVLEGDQLIAINGLLVLPEQNIDELRTRLRGDVGAAIRLSLRRNDQQFDVDVTLAEITPPSVLWRMLDNAPAIGYVSVRLFTDRTAGDTQHAIDDLRTQGARQLVLDLRDNGGGLLQSAVDVAGHFVDGLIMTQVHRDGTRQEFAASATGHARDLPLVVLVNHSTASASEIVAGALRDRRQAPLIGEQTYGKGSVQNIFPLLDGASLHVTTAVWFTPNEQPFSGVGLAPDIVVVPSAEDRAAGRDPVLEQAIAYLSQQP
jgi:carboxyl-terminal processing protease